MEDNKDMQSIFNQLDKLLESTDIKDVNAETTGFVQLKSGYYLCEVKKAELKLSKTSKKPMVAFQFKIVEDGTNFTFDSKSKATPITLKNTKNRMLFKYYVFNDENSIRRFASDMLKFEGETAGEPILSKEYFTNSELLEDALDILAGSYIYIHNDVNKNDDGTESAWVNLVSWSTAAKLGLTM